MIRLGTIMTTNIFVNLPTTDLERAKAFYVALGYTINPLFTDDNAACVMLGDNLFFMVVTQEFLGTFTDKQVIDPRTHVGAMIGLSCDTRDGVDDILAKGLAAGGTEPRPPQDYGFMYARDLEDPDGNILSYFFMEPAASEQAPEAYLAEQGAAESPST